MTAIAGPPPITYEKLVRCDEQKDAGAVPCILFDAPREVACVSNQIVSPVDNHWAGESL
jgi:hypothetical protein